ncbi:hypothetical protein TrLO_g3515 [Triparma laevis f. longispina]|uniref:Uncharacterized protein n=1 Tax=Triparma laevis f. longispina TaxID=1714387 RepID=A0A9W7CKD1_9STRA|nr:hypothetical protein TrLO_g3515 [Triparma laevis f. longispina]
MLTLRRLTAHLKFPAPPTPHPRTQALSSLGKGTDLVPAFSADGGIQRIILQGYTPNEGYVVSDMNRARILPSSQDGEEINVGGVEDMEILGSLIATQYSCFLWRPDPTKPAPADLTAEDSSLWNPLELLITKSPEAPDNIELVILGVERSRMMSARNGGIPDAVLKRLKYDKNTPIEVMETAKAIATFNILNGEDRNVIAAMICEPLDA